MQINTSVGRQHFEEVLNCPEPVITHDFSTEDVIQLDTDTVPITHDEVRRAIKQLELMPYRQN